MSLPNILHNVPQHILDESHSFLYEKGLEGCEGTALWIGRPDGDRVSITRLFIPEQICIKTPYGVAVDLTERAHYTLTDNLESGERFFVRIHSHPEEAYHSHRDNQNPILTHQGALSIVVPNFAVDPIDLSRCAIFRREYGTGWLPLSPGDFPCVFKIVR